MGLCVTTFRRRFCSVLVYYKEEKLIKYFFFSPHVCVKPEFYSYIPTINEKYKKTFYKRLIIDMKATF